MLLEFINEIPKLVISGLAGGTLAHLLARYRDIQKDKDKIRNEAHSILCAVSFTLIAQYEELFNLQKDLKERLNITNEILGKRESLIKLFQDFQINCISINLEYFGELLAALTKLFPNCANEISSIIRDCYHSNNKYLKALNYLKNYNGLKKTIPQDSLFEANLFKHLDNHIPAYLEYFNKTSEFILHTHSTLSTLFKLIDKIAPQIDGRVREI